MSVAAMIERTNLIGTKVWDSSSHECGFVRGVRDCTIEGCGCLKLGVRWPDGKMTWPCIGGMDVCVNGDFVIR